MCKLFIMTNTSKIDKNTISKIIKETSKVMYKTERDGFGISARTDKGIFNRRFLSPLAASLDETRSKQTFLKESVNQDGTLGNISALILHGRTSTNHLGLINTHPISKHGLHLCHNGVVEDSGPKFEMVSQNDTEFLVERLAQGMDSIEKYISGYYAFASFKDNTQDLIIVRDSIASLYFAEIPSLDCHVFATTRDIIKTVLKAAKIKYLPIEELQDNIKLLYQGKNLVEQTSIKPKGRTAFTDSLSSKSLGHDLSLSPVLNHGFSSEIESELANETMFFNEIDQCADHTWTFLKGKFSYTLDEFFELSYYDQLSCIVIRSDGTVCSPDDRYNGSFFDGQVSNG